VIAVMQSMAAGRMPLPREERLLRFGLHALAVARETSACPAFLALLRQSPIELEWLFSEDERSTRVGRLLLGLFDGDDTGVHALIADTDVDDDTRGGLLSALARLVWEGRASRDALLALLDRLDREELARPGSALWLGWATTIMLLGLTDWVDRVQRAQDGDRDIPMFDREVDRNDWLERLHAAAANPDDEQRFVDEYVMAYDDAVKDIGWSADGASDGPEDPLCSDELAWLDVTLWRRAGTATMCLEWADGFLTALAAGPERVLSSEYLPEILGADMVCDSPEHADYIAALLARHLASIEYLLTEDEEIEPQINFGVGDLEGSLWAQGYLTAVEKHQAAWKPFTSKHHLVDRLIAPVLALFYDPADKSAEVLPPEMRRELIEALPNVVAATWSFWRGQSHPLLPAPRERSVKIGRNDPCPCGSGKKYKRCCGAVA
jgi:uncharacterized protein